MSMQGPEPSSEDLAALAGKYRLLSALRREREQGAEPPPRQVFKDLSTQFPGALNELDSLTLDEIDARAQALTEAMQGARPAPWMRWLFGYHALFRGALTVKARLRNVPAGALVAPEIVATASSKAGFSLRADFLKRAAALVDGRLRPVVLDELAHLYGASAEDIECELFPRGRRARSRQRSESC